MQFEEQIIQEYNKSSQEDHQATLGFVSDRLAKKGIDTNEVISKIQKLQIAVPSWALGSGGTRFGRFSIGGEPTSLEQKIEDIGLLHQLTQATDSVSLHIPWDIPSDTNAIKELAVKNGLSFDAVNSNTFQDQSNQSFSYKFGSLCHVDKSVRDQAVAHNQDVINIGNALGSKSMTVWLADGSCFPGQMDFSRALENTMNSLIEIYNHMPSDWKLFVEYKPYEPNFYSTVIQDWGTSHMLAKYCGENAYSLVDLGHHLPNTNIEQIVSTLIWLGKLGGFHFNDSKYGDDDLTVGSVKPYQLFLIFNELVSGLEKATNKNPDPAWMIDASHNVKDPMEDLMQSLEAIHLAYAQALIVDRVALEEARLSSDVVRAQEILQEAYRTDVRSLVREARISQGGVIDPVGFYRAQEVRNKFISERGEKTVATGL